MILDKLVEATKKRIEKEKMIISPEEVKEKALSMPKGNFEFEKALKGSDISFICEIKKASPSKGIIAENFPYKDIAVEYEKAGASCISVLTEPDYFKGNIEYLGEIRKCVNIPLLRKDFTIDEYMIYDAKIHGANAVLLICSILDKETIARWIELCDRLGISALVEAHNEDEINMAIEAKARIIGVNNRNLKDFTVDINNSVRLRKLVPKDILFVAESGISTNQDIKELRKAGVDGVLIGETFMKSESKAEMLKELKGE
ncbi:indole-3-glycerol phosphate synthase TrpC [Eubacterium sp.]